MNEKALKDANYRKRAYQLGGKTTMPASILATHIRTLQAQGMGYKRIADISGVDFRSLQRIQYGQYKRVSRENAEAILAVEFDPAPSALIDSIGTQRRIQALSYVGWPLRWISQRVGVAEDCSLWLLQRDKVYRTTADRYGAMYVQLIGMEPPQATSREQQAVAKARARARRDGWVPDAAWDDMDDPRERPKGARKEAA
jgi:hypothetical protein